MTKKATQNIHAEREFFNRFGGTLDYDVFSEAGYKRIIDDFLGFITPLEHSKENLRALDCGCGTGSFTARFSESGFELYGIDISPGSIAHAKKKYPHIIFKVGNVDRMEFPDEHFDVIFLSGVLHHFPDFSPVLKECHRVLRVGGILLGYDPHRGNPFMRLYRCKESPFYSSKGVTENERPLSRREIEVVLRSLEYSDVKVYSISGVTYKYVDSRLSFVILPLYNCLEHLMDCKPLRDRFGSFLITYARK